jgi:phosphoenolpyruvate-protein phosphotransferase (PTS system enzyme I)
MRTVRGIPASTGVARGPWIVIGAGEVPAGGRIAPGQADVERERLGVARDAAAAELEALAAELTSAGRDEGEIFDAQAMMARDPSLLDAATTAIGEGHDAIGAIRIAAEGVAAQLRALGDELLAARAADVLDVAERIAARLAGVDRTVALDHPSIVVAEDIPPSIAASLPRDRLLGMALQSGSATSHAAILARAFGIPAVVGVAGLLDAARSPDGAGESVAVIDGDSGEVVFEPDAAAASRLEGRRAAADQAARQALEEASLPTVTRDDVEVTLLANIGTPAEAERAVALGARGVGLFRTEFLFVERAAAPSEDEQVAANRAVVDAFAPGPVTIRLLDVGGDKPIPWLPIPAEANPFLGVRALRLAGEQPDLFITQLRAAMRAAAGGGRVKVMAPMVADAVDVDVLLDLAERARTGLDADGLPHGEVDLGVMLEIPSAVLVAPSFFERIRFASLGTNDLLQYTLAADRGNPALERYRDPLHPALLRLIASAEQDAETAGVELSVCGEMGGDPAAALALVGLGVTVLSMAASSLAPVRRAVRAADADQLREVALTALDARSAAEVRARFEALLRAA